GTRLALFGSDIAQRGGDGWEVLGRYLRHNGSGARSGRSYSIAGAAEEVRRSLPQRPVWHPNHDGGQEMQTSRRALI
ncbi:MAG: hypothetical protein KGO02_12885, partial [Alphaproteobacteria bacterium]|nr:hypothetical protein [Alphaproteobacteria bacterium]